MAYELFAFLPYIRSRQRCVIRGLEFRPLDDRDGLNPDTRKHVECLGRMFFTCQGEQIAAPTFAVASIRDKQALAKTERMLVEAQLLVTYLYGAPHPSPTMGDDVFLSAECSALFVFRPAQIAKTLAHGCDSEIENLGIVGGADQKNAALGMVDGYEGRRNGIVPLWVSDGSRIYPEVPNICLNYSQNLETDIDHFLSRDKNWPFRSLFGPADLTPENQTRIFGSLLWYSRSCRETTDQAERLLCLAVALESLLAVEKGERLTDRFKAAVRTLVGPVERLDEWLDQFYAARSTTVHLGRPNQLWFALPTAKKKDHRIPHRALAVYARRIFRICLTAVLSGVIVTEASAIESLLIHNDERLEKICSLLSDKKVAPEDRVLSARHQIEELSLCATLSFGIQLEEDLGKLFGAAKVVFQVYGQCTKTGDPHIDQGVKELANSRRDESGERIFENLKKMAELLRKRVCTPGNRSEIDAIVFEFVEFASRPAVGLEVHFGDFHRKTTKKRRK